MILPGPVRRIGRRIVRATPWLRRHLLASSDYRLLDGPDEARASAAASEGWLARRPASRQQRAYGRLIGDMKGGHPRLDFAVAAEAVAASGMVNPRLLEVGCGSAYYSEVFAT